MTRGKKVIRTSSDVWCFAQYHAIGHRACPISGSLICSSHSCTGNEIIQSVFPYSPLPSRLFISPAQTVAIWDLSLSDLIKNMAGKKSISKQRASQDEIECMWGQPATVSRVTNCTSWSSLSTRNLEGPQSTVLPIIMDDKYTPCNVCSHLACSSVGDPEVAVEMVRSAAQVGRLQGHVSVTHQIHSHRCRL